MLNASGVFVSLAISKTPFIHAYRKDFIPQTAHKVDIVLDYDNT